LHSEGIRMVINNADCILVCCFESPQEFVFLASGMTVTYTVLRK
jgi:hypothetical protein